MTNLKRERRIPLILYHFRKKRHLGGVGQGLRKVAVDDFSLRAPAD